MSVFLWKSRFFSSSATVGDTIPTRPRTPSMPPCWLRLRLMTPSAGLAVHPDRGLRAGRRRSGGRHGQQRGRAPEYRCRSDRRPGDRPDHQGLYRRHDHGAMKPGRRSSSRVRGGKGNLHFFGLVSDAGVHAMLEHLYALALTLRCRGGSGTASLCTPSPTAGTPVRPAASVTSTELEKKCAGLSGPARSSRSADDSGAWTGTTAGIGWPRPTTA